MVLALNNIINHSASTMKIEVRPFKSMVGSSSDHAPFLKKKFEVADFTSMKDKQIHSKDDTLDKINPVKLSDAVALIKDVILTIDSKIIQEETPAPTE